MNWSAIAFDWNQVRAFLATAEEGSMSAAARALGLTQPTLSRQVTALEEALGVLLFDRGPRSMVLTAAGQEVLGHVRAMGDAALRVSLAASGQSQEAEGEVCVTATDLFAAHYLPPILERLAGIAPRLAINLVTSNDVRDLGRREADISIRHVRPDQPDLIGRLVWETTANLYASRGYLDRFGRGKPLDALHDLDVIGFRDSETVVAFMRGVGVPIGPENVRLTTESGFVLIALMRQGFGASMMTRDAAEWYGDLEPVSPGFAPMTIPVWLVTHRELRTSRRIRVVYDLLAEELSRPGGPRPVDLRIA